MASLRQCIGVAHWAEHIRPQRCTASAVRPEKIKVKAYARATWSMSKFPRQNWKKYSRILDIYTYVNGVSRL